MAILPPAEIAGTGSTDRTELSRNIPRFATCSTGGCYQPNVRGSSCSTCIQHFCTVHKSKNIHTCPSSSELDENEWAATINKEVEELITRINLPALIRHAEELNGGRQCFFKPGKHLGNDATMGCANYHASLQFEGGKEWLVRIPRTPFDDVPPSLIEYLVSSEYATLKFLETTNVPSPKVFGYGIASDPKNLVGVSYILMEKLDGKPYYQHDATFDQQSHVLGQIADILLELSRFPFDKAGSLIMEDGEFRVSSTASNRWVQLDRYGPYESAIEYFSDIADQYLDLISDRQVYDEFPKEAFLFYRLLQQQAEVLSASNSNDRFYLKHVDDKGDHILVDENYNITGIIDWQFARTVPSIEAFGPSLLTADLQSLYSSNSRISEGDRLLADKFRARGAENLARYMSSSELVRRFAFGLASGLRLEEVYEMIKGMLECIRPGEVIDIQKWIEGEAIKCETDSRWHKIQEGCK